MSVGIGNTMENRDEMRKISEITPFNVLIVVVMKVMTLMMLLLLLVILQLLLCYCHHYCYWSKVWCSCGTWL